MKRFGMFLATSCLGATLALPSAAAQQQPPQDQQTQQPQQPQPQAQTQPGTSTQTTQTQTTQPPAAQRQHKLPRTASPMPLVALAGMLSLAGAGLMRRLRKSAA